MPLLVGEDPLDHERLYEKLFRATYSRASAELAAADGQPHFGLSGRPQMMAAIAGVDIALWDLKAQAVGMPSGSCSEAGGGRLPHTRAAATTAPGRADVDGLVEEMTGYRELGYGAVKMKVGGLAVADDVERVRAVREALPDCELMLTQTPRTPFRRRSRPRGRSAVRHPLAREAGCLVDPVFGLARVGEATSIPLASGERELHRFACRDLVDHTPIRYLQFDCTRAGGYRVAEGRGLRRRARCPDGASPRPADPRPPRRRRRERRRARGLPERGSRPRRDGLFAVKPEIVAGEVVLLTGPGSESSSTATSRAPSVRLVRGEPSAGASS